MVNGEYKKKRAAGKVALFYWHVTGECDTF